PFWFAVRSGQCAVQESNLNCSLNHEPQTIPQHFRTSSLHGLHDLLAGVASREVREDDVAILESIGECGDVVEVDVAILRGVRLMTVPDERALDHEDFRLVE